MSGITGTQAELLYSMPAPVTKNTYTTQALIGPVATTAPVPHIPGGYFSDNPNPLGRVLYLQAFGLIGTTTGPPTFWPELGLDTVPGTLANGIPIYASISQTVSVIAQWNMQAWITCTAYGDSPATTGGLTLQVNGTWAQTTVATGGAANAGGLSAQFAATITGLFPTTTYYVELFGTWGTSNVLNTTTIQQMTFWGLN
jgi:hypothetical protein